MLKRIVSAPKNVLAVKASGTLTDSDYKTVLIPAVEEQIKAAGKIRLVYEIGPEFDGFDAGAAMDDALLGLKHWREFEKIAVVTDHAWLANTVRLFLPLFPKQTKLFAIGQAKEAIAWAAA